MKEYLSSHGLPFVVAVSEDATAVIGKREYSAKRNSVVGNSLPLGKRGLPNAEDAIVTSAVDIIKLMERPRASVVFVVMAQPIADGFPPMRICTFGSDNRFTYKDVQNRLSAIEAALKAHGIGILTYSSDGDTRELKMMRQHLQLGTVPTTSKNS